MTAVSALGFLWPLLLVTELNSAGIMGFFLDTDTIEILFTLLCFTGKLAVKLGYLSLLLL